MNRDEENEHDLKRLKKKAFIGIRMSLRQMEKMYKESLRVFSQGFSLYGNSINDISVSVQI